MATPSTGMWWWYTSSLLVSCAVDGAERPRPHSNEVHTQQVTNIPQQERDVEEEEEEEEEGEGEGEGIQVPLREVSAGSGLRTLVAEWDWLRSVAGNSYGIGLRDNMSWPVGVGVDPLACINEVGGAGSEAAENIEDRRSPDDPERGMGQPGEEEDEMEEVEEQGSLL